MNSSTSQIPLACNMSVFTPAERESHIQTSKQLFQSVQTIHDVAHGYEFNFPNNSDIITRMAEFISGERLCCSFLEFTLKVPPGNEPIALVLTGPEGTQEFLRAEFSEAFA